MSSPTVPVKMQKANPMVPIKLQNAGTDVIQWNPYGVKGWHLSHTHSAFLCASGNGGYTNYDEYNIDHDYLDYTY
jgi:hypothetical protein